MLEQRRIPIYVKDVEKFHHRVVVDPKDTIVHLLSLQRVVAQRLL